MITPEDKSTDNISTEISIADNLVPIIPLKDVVIFPNMVVPLFVGRQKSINALEVADKKDKQVILLSQKNPADNDVNPENLHLTGTLAKILQILPLPDGTKKVLIEGKTRAKAKLIVDSNGFLAAEVEEIKTKQDINKIELEAQRREIIQLFDEFAKLNQKVPDEVVSIIAKISNIEQLADVIITHVIVDLAVRQELLETASLKKRLALLLRELNREIEILNVERKIQGRVKQQIEKNQKEYYLHEQQRAIQNELGEGEEQNEIQELESKTVKFQVEANHSQSTMNELRSRLSQKTAECDQLIIKIKDIEKRSSETSATTKDEAKKLAELEKRHQQLISDLHAAKAESSQKDSQLNDLKTRLEAQSRESKTAIDSYKLEIDKYIQDNGTLRAAEATAQRQLRHLKDTHQAQTGQYSQRENTVKELDRENKELRVRIKEIEEKLEEKIRAIEGLGRLAEAGRKVESVREAHGECVVLAKKEVDGLKEKEQKLMVEVKSMKETIAKKDVRIVELSSNVETLKTELEKKGQLEVQIKDLQSKLDVARSEAQNLAKNTKSGQTEISVLQGKVAQLQKDLVAQLEQTDSNKAEVNVVCVVWIN